MTIEQIIDAIKEMKVLELNELVKKAEEEFGVSAAAPVAVGVAAGPAESAEEKSEFDVILAEAGNFHFLDIFLQILFHLLVFHNKILVFASSLHLLIYQVVLLFLLPLL